MARERPLISPEIRPGLSGERDAVVTEAMVTTHAGGGRGGVLTTSAMIALMEETAQEATRPHLPSDHTTVGFEVSVRHLASTFVGGRVRVRAELVEVDDRKLRFDVEAHNEERRIGVGTLRRTIVRLGHLDDKWG